LLSPYSAGTAEEEYVKVPKALLRGLLDKTLDEMTRPPSKKHAGKRLRASAPWFLPASILSEELAVSHGFPEADAAVGLERGADGELQPSKKTATAEVYKLKLQDPAHVRAFARFGDRLPSRGRGSTKLLLTAAAEKRGKKAKKAVKMAGPVIIRCSQPLGIAKNRKLPSGTLKTNVLMMDEHGDITFGVKDYPAQVSAPATAIYSNRCPG
jgi:hypothetical protein